MITNNTVIPFQVSADPEPLEHKSIEDIRKEWATYFTEKKNDNLE